MSGQKGGRGRRAETSRFMTARQQCRWGHAHLTFATYRDIHIPLQVTCMQESRSLVCSFCKRPMPWHLGQTGKWGQVWVGCRLQKYRKRTGPALPLPPCPNLILGRVPTKLSARSCARACASYRALLHGRVAIGMDNCEERIEVDTSK